jgi:hypothetical protein
VLDGASGRIVTNLPIRHAAFEIAFDESSRLLFNPNGDGSMSVFREDAPDRFSEQPTIQTADAEAGGTLDGVTHRIYLINRQSPDHRINILVLAP